MNYNKVLRDLLKLIKDYDFCMELNCSDDYTEYTIKLIEENIEFNLSIKNDYSIYVDEILIDSSLVDTNLCIMIYSEFERLMNFVTYLRGLYKSINITPEKLFDELISYKVIDEQNDFKKINNDNLNLLIQSYGL